MYKASPINCFMFSQLEEFASMEKLGYLEVLKEGGCMKLKTIQGVYTVYQASYVKC